MKIGILSTRRRLKFAHDLIDRFLDLKGNFISYIPCINEAPENLRTKVALRNEIEGYDVILAVIDNEFNADGFLHKELNIVASMISRNPEKILIPVILDDAAFPATLRTTACIRCISTSGDCVEKTRWMIENVINNSGYMIQKKASEKKKYDRFFRVFRIVLLCGLIACGIIIYLMSRDRATYMTSIEEIGALLVIVITAVCTYPIMLAILEVAMGLRRENDKEEMESYSRRLQQTIVSETTDQSGADCIKREDNKNEVIDALGRMLINLEDIKEFYTWSQRQAKQSFFLAVVLCISGFALIVISVVLAVTSNTGFEVTIISTVGGVATELIAGTALVVYKNSLSQLNHYHKALHEDERFLSSVNLLGKFSTVEAQDNMLREIIKSEIQLNLAGVNDSIAQDDAS